MPNLLVLSFYFEPDLCAGSFRATPLVAALQERAPAGTRIDVITTLPNRYRTFTREAAEHERRGPVEIRRIRLPAHRSDMLGQSLAFLEFARQVRRLTRKRRYDLVFATSSRLMTAALGAAIARRHRSPLYLDIRDLFVDTIKDVLPGPAAHPVRAGCALLERWTFARADRINVVSAGFQPYVHERYGSRPLACFTHGVDEEFLSVQPRTVRPRTGGGTLSILYAGNIGEGQALHRIIPGLARRLRGRARFVVIGDGGRRDELECAVREAQLENVTLMAPRSRSELLQAYLAADVLFLHLGPYPAFDKVLPSKLFEYAALGKPILAGVSGYAAEFVRAEIDNCAVFPPCDLEAAVAALDRLALGEAPRETFARKYSRSKVIGEMADDVLALLPASRADGICAPGSSPDPGLCAKTIEM